MKSKYVFCHVEYLVGSSSFESPVRYPTTVLKFVNSSVDGPSSVCQRCVRDTPHHANQRLPDYDKSTVYVPYSFGDKDVIASVLGKRRSQIIVNPSQFKSYDQVRGVSQAA